MYIFKLITDLDLLFSRIIIIVIVIIIIAIKINFGSVSVGFWSFLDCFHLVLFCAQYFSSCNLALR